MSVGGVGFVGMLGAMLTMLTGAFGGCTGVMGKGALGMAICTDGLSLAFPLKQFFFLRRRHHAAMNTMTANAAPDDITIEMWWIPSKWAPPLSPVYSTTGGGGWLWVLELHMWTVVWSRSCWSRNAAGLSGPNVWLSLQNCTHSCLTDRC